MEYEIAAALFAQLTAISDADTFDEPIPVFNVRMDAIVSRDSGARDYRIRVADAGSATTQDWLAVMQAAQAAYDDDVAGIDTEIQNGGVEFR